jgi:single-stranded-DNA-specific exonuclease
VSKPLTKRDIATLLEERFKDDSCKKISQIPPPSMFKDIKKASTRIKKAIKNREMVALVGDYDADGVIATVILSEFFEYIGKDVKIKIPNRFSDGYGINCEIIDDLDVDLIITVDNGISAFKAGERCIQKGIDLIITDHHIPSKDLPLAFAIVNPKQDDCKFPFSDICGANVAWYLVAQLKDDLGVEYDLVQTIDILTIAIVADMMPLIDINRAIVKRGLKAINSSSRPFFQAIKNMYNKDSFQSEDISFMLAPLINSSGRMEDATLSYELIKSKDIESANIKLEYIKSLNSQRKKIETNIFLESTKYVTEDENIIVVWGEGWHEGVIGIVASRLVNRYKKPSIVFSVNKDIAKGSARSIGDLDILRHISKESEYLLGFGGHKGAAGMSIKASNLKKFKEAMVDSLRYQNGDIFQDSRDILGNIDISTIDFELLDILQHYEPYGQGNPKPHFLIKNVLVNSHRLLGVEQNHQKMLISSDSTTIESIDFNYDTLIKEGEVVDFSCVVSKNQFRGNSRVQLIIDRIETSE